MDGTELFAIGKTEKRIKRIQDLAGGNILWHLKILYMTSR